MSSDTPSQTIIPSSTALIIIDPQHDFCSPQGALAQRFGFDMVELNKAVPRLNKLIQDCRDNGVLVVWVREVFADSKLLPNQKALWGAGDDIWLIREDGEGIDWYSEMTPPLDGENVITKWQYDAFTDTDLGLLLRSKGIDTLLMTGFATNVCVETTARRGYHEGYNIVVVPDCCGAPTQSEHDAAIFNLSTYFGKAVESSALALGTPLATTVG